MVNTAKDFKLVIGSNSMIPGFEDQLVDKKINSDFEIKTNFLMIISRKILQVVRQSSKYT